MKQIENILFQRNIIFLCFEDRGILGEGMGGKQLSELVQKVSDEMSHLLLEQIVLFIHY